jgi:hypothetical protein
MHADAFPTFVLPLSNAFGLLLLHELESLQQIHDEAV